LSFLPGLWLLVSLSWIEHPWAKSKVLRWCVFSVAAILILVVWTNEWHHLWYESIVPSGVTGFARFQRGVLYFPLFGVLASAFVVSAVLLLLHPKKSVQMTHKAIIVLVANVFPPLFAVAFQLGLRPGGLDPTIFSLIPAFIVLSVGLFRHDFIRLVPIARDLIVESLEQPVLVFDAAERLVDHNAAAEAYLPEFEAALKGVVADRGELPIVMGDGTRTFRYRRTPIPGAGPGPHGTVAIFSDITEEKTLLGVLAHQATHDALTGVANRRHFEDHAVGEITRAARSGGTLALVLFDLDHFKDINDKYGHQSGDKVLKGVVASVLGKLRNYDLLARVGGEEFAVLMPGVNPVEAHEAAERWRAGLEQTPHVLPGAVKAVTASFGVATLNDLPLTLPADARLRLDTLMGLADRALYQAKADGRNRVC
jgi:diguanylate cyclase (GGDEF)-like protein